MVFFNLYCFILGQTLLDLLLKQESGDVVAVHSVDPLAFGLIWVVVRPVKTKMAADHGHQDKCNAMYSQIKIIHQRCFQFFFFLLNENMKNLYLIHATSTHAVNKVLR